MTERRLKVLLALFFVALAVPSVVLVAQAYSQLKWEAFRQTQSLAEDLSARIDADLRSAVAAEEARAFGDYAFLVVEGDVAANFVQRSTLSAFPVESAVSGALGYFQVDAAGELTTPLLPAQGVDAARYGISQDEHRARLALESTIRDVLVENRLVQRATVREQGEEDLSASPPEAVDDSSSGAGSGGSAATGASADADADAGSRGHADAASDADAGLDTPSAVRAGPTISSERERARISSLGQSRSVPNAATSASAAAFSVADASAEPGERAQAAFDRLKAEGQSLEVDRELAAASRGAARRVEQLNLEAPFADRAIPAPVSTAEEARQKRTEQTLVPEPALQRELANDDDGDQESVTADEAELRVRMFESELDPLEVGLLDTGHLVLFRNAWRDGQRYIQGIVVDRERFLAGAVEAALAGSSLAGISDLTVAYAGNVLGAAGVQASRGYPAAELAGSLLYRARMSPPFGDLELIFSVMRLPRAAGSVLLAWVTVTLAAVLCGGFFFMYRFAAGQIRLTRQQQDFVSAVSHELRTPLTSIRMYGEMLKAGWADEAKKQTYYEYIHDEAERLSRLIENVLQLARLTRNTSQFDIKRVSVAELFDIVRSRIDSQVEHAGFRLDIRNDANSAELMIDADCFTQVVINLVDNALKFSAAAERKVIELSCRKERDDTLLFTVRDFGPGIPKGQMKKIFELFYRPPNTLTRETVGTGIGLALVQQLVTAMDGRVEARNCEPGVEFRMSFDSIERS